MANEQISYYLERASKEGWAVPHLNFNDCWDLEMIVEAAEELRAPVFVASIQNVVKTLGLGMCSAIGGYAMRSAKVPVFLHMDHSNSVELCKQCVDAGYASVMIDSSAKSLEENIADTKEVMAYAAKRNVHVEAEIGRILGRDEEGTYEKDDFLVRVDDAKAFAEATGVGALAVGIGTQHGFYRGKPNLNFKRLEEVDAVVDIPLVLHGGTGIPVEDVRHAIKCGVNKVNVGTIIRYTYMTELHNEIERAGAAVHPGILVQSIKEKVKDVVKDAIRMCYAENKA